MTARQVFCVLALPLAGGWCLGPSHAAEPVDWPAYGGDAGGTRYSAATQINRSNVAGLQLAWTYRTGDMDQDVRAREKAAFETTPILVDAKLFLTTPYGRVVALDARTGQRAWEFDARINLDRDYSEVSNRGVAAWRDTRAKPNAPCRLRIFLGTIDARLIALDGVTGLPCADFGAQGTVDLTREAVTQTDWSGGYQVTSAPAMAGDLVIVGSSIADNWRMDVGRGIVRAYDARTGKLRWSWDPIPWSSTTTPRSGGGNAWSTLSVDAGHDLVFVPTGSASPDYYGGLRQGDNKWANSVVALRASTGRFVWGFQVVHHGLWDYDVASQPTLFTWKDGTPAVAINTKMGHVFVLNRLNGKPLLPVEERAVPQSDVAGETASRTQPFPTIALVPERFSPADAWGPTPEDVKWCREKAASLRNEGIFTPPSVRGTLAFPGNVGGVNWGGAAYDPDQHVMIVNTNRLVAWVKLIPSDQFGSETRADQDNRIYGEFASQRPAPYGLYRSFLFSPSKTPCNAPPWGTTEAVDLYTGKTLWDVPLGTMIAGQQTGSINLGGPIVTAGGLVFTAASADSRLHAFDSTTGKELWGYALPAGGQATPMTYVLDDSQYLVIAAGGHGKLGTKQGDYIFAFSSP